MNINRIKYYIVFLFISFFLSAQAQSDSTIHIQLIDATFPETLERLSVLSGYSISYNPDIFSEEEDKITIDTVDSFLRILQHVVKDRPYALSRTRRGNIVVRYDQSRERTLVSGRVVDALTGEPLMACNIYKSDRSVGTTSNEYGYFSIKIPTDDKPLVFSYLGYEKYFLKYKDEKERSVKIKLNPSAELDEVLIYNNDSVDNSLTQQGIVEINLADIRDQPAAGGEEDLSTMVRVLPGVQSGADGIGGLFVRGGTDDQNLITLDGSTLYFPSHVFGLYSLVNSSSLRRAVVSKDNHLVPSGKRLSSSIDIWSREGNTQKISGMVQVAPSGARAVLEGPISPSTSFIVTGRRSLITPTRIFPEENTGRTGAHTDILFYDYSAKISQRIAGHHQLIAHFLKGVDRYQYQVITRTGSGLERDELRAFDWGNTLMSLRYNVSLGNAAYLKTGIHRTQFDYIGDQVQYYEQTPGSSRDRLLSARSSIDDIRIHADVDLQHGNEQYTRMGLSLTRHDLINGLRFFNGPDIFNTAEDLNTALDNSEDEGQVAYQYDAYMEEILAIGPAFQFQIALFTSLFRTDDQDYLRLLPKVSIRFRPDDIHTFFFYAQENAQNVHKLDIDAPGYPTSLWVLANQNISPKTSRLLSAQYHTRWNKSIRTELGVYWTGIKNLLFIDQFPRVNPYRVDRGRLDLDLFATTLNGSSAGVEFKFTVEKEKWTTRLNYTYADTDRSIAETGRSVRPRQDRRHTADLLWQYKWNKQFNVSIIQSYGSENAAQYTHASFNHVLQGGIQGDIASFESRTDDFSLNSIFRTDLNLQYEFDLGGMHHSLAAGVYNLFDRRQDLYRWIDPIAQDDLSDPDVTSVLSLGRQFQLRYAMEF